MESWILEIKPNEGVLTATRTHWIGLVRDDAVAFVGEKKPSAGPLLVRDWPAPGFVGVVEVKLNQNLTR